MAELTDADRIRLRQMTEQEWVAAASAADWEACVALCSNDVEYMPPDSPGLRGHDELRGFLEAFPTIVDFSQSIQTVSGTSDLAVLRGSFAVTVEAEDGQVSGEGKVLATAAKTGEDWEFSAVCFNWNAPL